MLGYYVMTSLSTKSSEAESFRTFYCELVAMLQGPRRCACVRAGVFKVGGGGGGGRPAAAAAPLCRAQV